ncbi:heterokaryon incompatibility protein-domain-containing protein [Xylaria sp. FL0933]|nr:heterokaryon incompatibility protein-domain-containing protein [Xylaria sp. FL0933]
MNRPHLIKSFIRDDFHEDMLPAILQEIFTQDGWRYSDVAEFCNTHQWYFFPLVFTKDRFRYDICSRMLLPYTPAAKALKTYDSHYSSVKRRAIYREYFGSGIQTVIDDDNNYCVAVKTLKDQDEQAAEKEAIALEGIRQSSNVHLIKAIAYICRGRDSIERSFVFPWAEHGNLWNFWHLQGGVIKDHEYFIKVFRQLACLAGAISELSDKGLRHGDLKPENIVCFKTDHGLPAGGEENHDIEVRLVIIDFRANTDTKVSTRRYAAPELETEGEGGLSRRFDVWSMGCGLLNFTAVEFPSDSEKFKFFVIGSTGGHLSSDKRQKETARHPKVDDLIAKMQNDPQCSTGTAIQRLLDLISQKMIVVDLGDDRHPDPEEQTQSTCKCVRDAHLASTFSTENDANTGQENEERSPLNDDWDYSPDNYFAREVFNSLDLDILLPRFQIPPTLCGRCRDLRLWSPICSFADSASGLDHKANREGCELCHLLLRNIHSQVSNVGNQQVHFSRAGCYLTLGDNRRQIVASLCTTFPRIADIQPVPENPFLHDVQIGFPELPPAASETHLEILKGWMTDCDRNHKCYPTGNSFVPTRLLYIGSKGSNTIQLLVTHQTHNRFGHYATLSHRWGSTQQHRFCTYKSNIEELKQGINIATLPRTFQDAVRITYGLGLKYLWIDSLCIIQDDPFDWETESKLMEHVFSSAYCTIAASCSFGSEDGFLKPRPARRYVTKQGLRDSDVPYFVCETIDDFFQDVEQSELNQRGWVLQERALSRRTIYFTERQSYWECDTDLKLPHSRKASFLGDPNFPRSVDQFAKGLRIEIFQNLYEKYSRLALSYPSDRPLAIRGLESRLIDTFGTTGGVGIFDIYLHRSLLWQRADNILKRITSIRDARVPSWSWMAYDGPICYLTVPFGGVTWSEDITSPFSKDSIGRYSASEGLKGRKSIATSPLELQAPVWNLLDAESGQRIMDDPYRVFDQPVQCVVLGKSKTSSLDESQVHWVLLVHPIKVADNVASYERVGVGILKKCHIAFDRPQERRRIQ